MKTSTLRITIPVLAIAIVLSCSDSAPEGEVWPKNGYLFTRNFDLDTVYVEGNSAVTTTYSVKFPLDDETKKWTIQLPSSGKGVLIHNGRNGYWSIDSAFHPGLNVKQRFIKIRTVTDPENLGPANRFIYHKGANGTFYIESAKFPDYYVTGLPHAESGRGLLLRHQSNGTWDFWVDDH